VFLRRPGIKHEPQPLKDHSRDDERRRRQALLEALPRLRRFARSLASNRHDADDLVQATVERALERGMPEEQDVLRWSFRVCKNLWIDELRAQRVRVVAAQRPELADEPTVSGEAVAVGELTLREVERAMATLPEEQRLVLSLVAVEGLSYRETAEVLETPIGTVMSRLARARAALATLFAASPASSVGDVESEHE
jgi:RNA polymerase sigma-70 factor (ECF subfamily)